MLGFGWVSLGPIEAALKAGQLEEAQRLLAAPPAQGQKRASKLLQQLARRFAERGRGRLQAGDAQAARGDLHKAEEIGLAEVEAAALRRDLAAAEVNEARTLLQAGEPGRAAEILAQLRERAARTPELVLLEQAAKGWQLAREMAGRGEFAAALDALAGVRRAVPPPAPALEALIAELERRRQTLGPLLVELHQAMESRHWHEVVRVSEKILEDAPQQADARKARSRAWQAIEPVTTVGLRRPAESAAETVSGPPAPQRFLLWIDGVGGYLVCLAPRVLLGQATAETVVDVPLVADVSRHHATLTRDGEGYLLEAPRPVRVNGQFVSRTILRPNDRLTLGQSCQIQFRQPVAVSTSARLDLVSGHRLPLAVDGVLLMADTLVLGPGTQVHVPLPELKQPVILYRHRAGLGVRYGGEFRVDGRPVQDRAILGPVASIAGDEFAFAIESVGTRMGRL
jgi:tetratricopeptide (TPR) repeat protein